MTIETKVAAVLVVFLCYSMLDSVLFNFNDSQTISQKKHVTWIISKQ